MTEKYFNFITITTVEFDYGEKRQLAEVVSPEIAAERIIQLTKDEVDFTMRPSTESELEEWFGATVDE